MKFQLRARHWLALRVFLWTAAVVVAIAHATGALTLVPLAQLENFNADARLRFFMAPQRTNDGVLDERIVIVDIDETSLAKFGHWPWGRGRMAALVDEIVQRQKAQVVGFDMVFAEPDASTEKQVLDRIVERLPSLADTAAQLRSTFDPDKAFARALEGRNVVLGFVLTQEPRSPGRALHRAGALPTSVLDAAAWGGRNVQFRAFSDYTPNLELLERAAHSSGYFNNVPEADGTVRTVPLLAQVGDRYFAALSLAMYRAYVGDPALQLEPSPWSGWLHPWGKLRSVVLAQGEHRQKIPVEELLNVRVPFRGAGGPASRTFKYHSASDLLNHRLDAGSLAGKLVIVGTTAPGLNDQRTTPVGDAYPGVEVHANLLSGLLAGDIRAQPDASLRLEVLQLVFIAGLMAFLPRRFKAVPAAVVCVVALAAWFAANWWIAYSTLGLVMPLSTVLLLGSAVFAGTLLLDHLQGLPGRALAKAFRPYLPAPLVAQMLRSPSTYNMKGKSEHLTVMFCDMQGFTPMTEHLEPEAVCEVMGHFFEALSEPIRLQRGTLDKYIGDCIMAFWGAPISQPHHAHHAVRAALDMVERLKKLNAESLASGKKPVALGIGLNTGRVVVGDMGPEWRRNYTVMGKPVTTASRIEALTRVYGLEVLVGDETQRCAEAGAPDDDPARWYWLEIDRVRVKGQVQVVTLFTPVAVGLGAALTPSEESRHWRLALAAYRLQHWDDAEGLLEGLQNAYPASSFQTLYLVFSERITDFRLNPPPADWAGEHTFHHK